MDDGTSLIGRPTRLFKDFIDKMKKMNLWVNRSSNRSSFIYEQKLLRDFILVHHLKNKEWNVPLRKLRYSRSNHIAGKTLKFHVQLNCGQSLHAVLMAMYLGKIPISVLNSVYFGPYLHRLHIPQNP